MQTKNWHDWHTPHSETEVGNSNTKPKYHESKCKPTINVKQMQTTLRQTSLSQMQPQTQIQKIKKQARKPPRNTKKYSTRTQNTCMPTRKAKKRDDIMQTNMQRTCLDVCIVCAPRNLIRFHAGAPGEKQAAIGWGRRARHLKHKKRQPVLQDHVHCIWARDTSRRQPESWPFK